MTFTAGVWARRRHSRDARRHPGVLALGNHLVDNGFTVAIPSLFGTPGAPAMRPGAVGAMVRGCVAREFAAFATNADRPVGHHLRALARDLNERTPGKGVGVIGQCFTGGFALAALEDSVLAPVLSQPSLPLPLTPRQREGHPTYAALDRVVAFLTERLT